MQEQKAQIIENTPLAEGMHRLRLACDTSKIVGPGQFVNIAVEGKFLRRPISLADYDEEGILLLYKEMGEGTCWLGQQPEGTILSVLLPLGTGYDLTAIPEGAALVAGGAGVPPMYCLAKRILDKKPELYLGFFSQEEAYFVEECRELGIPVHVQIGGFISDAVPEGSYVCACGPNPMLRALDAKASGGQYSVESRMGCGFGACMGCSLKTASGAKRICREGPVFKREELLW